MDTLLNPDIGLLIWTIISFLILVGLLKRFAWGPLLSAVEAREAAMREERERAERARREAEEIQRRLEERLAGAQAEAKEVLAQAGRDGEALRARLRQDAESESKAMLDRTRTQLEEDKRRLVAELRREVADLSVQAAERLMSKSVDKGVQKSVLDQFFGELDKAGKH